MVTWTQMYMPMGGLGLSALVALIPIIFFFVALAVCKRKANAVCNTCSLQTKLELLLN